MIKLLASYKTYKLFAIILCMAVLFMPQLSLAAPAAGATPGGGGGTPTIATADKNDIVTILCNVIKFITGGIGKAIAIIILISLAISLFLGKVSWGLAIAVAVGMGILFGATTMINAITDGVGGNSGSTPMCP